METIYPVILKVPAARRNLRGKAGVKFFSRYARSALDISAKKTALILDVLKKDVRGAPLPCNGIFWSITHKRKYVGGVAAVQPIGIDIEELRPFTPSLEKRITTASEWNLSDDDLQRRFFRYWTAKEAVLKATGRGMVGLSECRVMAIHDAYHLAIQYEDRRWEVEQIEFDGHMASIVKYAYHVNWILPEMESGYVHVTSNGV